MLKGRISIRRGAGSLSEKSRCPQRETWPRSPRGRPTHWPNSPLRWIRRRTSNPHTPSALAGRPKRIWENGIRNSAVQASASTWVRTSHTAL